MDPVKELTQWPKSWHVIGRSRDFSRKPQAVDFGGRRLLVVRNAQGQIRAISAYCSHMGADLTYGGFDGEHVRCPMHGWQYDLTGRCVALPEGAEIPRFAQQTYYGAAEAHGVVAIFDGSVPAFPLPFFAELSPADFAAAKPLRHESPVPWFWVAANGFDARHFRIVHGRRLLAPAQVTQSSPDMLQVVYKFAIEGLTSTDRLLMKIAGKEAELSFTTWRGNIILAETRFGPTRVARFLSFISPLGPHRCVIDIIPLQKRLTGLGPLSGLATWLALSLRRWLTSGFFRDEAATLKNLGHTPVILTEEDAVLRQYFRWMRQINPA